MYHHSLNDRRLGLGQWNYTNIRIITDTTSHLINIKGLC